MAKEDETEQRLIDALNAVHQLPRQSDRRKILGNAARQIETYLGIKNP